MSAVYFPASFGSSTHANSISRAGTTGGSPLSWSEAKGFARPSLTICDGMRQMSAPPPVSGLCAVWPFAPASTIVGSVTW